MHIGWDLDDVTTNFTEELLRLYNLRYNRSASAGDARDWSFFPEDVRNLVTQNGYASLKPKPESVEILRRLKGMGDRVSIITYRSPEFEPQTRGWLMEHIPGLYDGLYMTGSSKKRVCVSLGIDVLVDDSRRQVVEAAGAGIHAVMLRTPMNSDISGNGFIHVADDFEGVFGWIEYLREKLA